MDLSSLAHCITPDEAAAFRRDGFLVLPAAIAPAQVSALLAALACIEAQVEPNRTSSYYNYADVLALDGADAILDQIDSPTLFPKIWGLLGFNIQITHSHINVDLPAPGEAAFAWHRDGAIATWDLPPPIPLLGIKVGHYLTDVEGEDRGCTFVVPGSHSAPRSPLPAHGQRPADAVPICGPPGTALLMDPRLVHCRGPNHSQTTRRALFLQYGFRWLRPLDATRVESLRMRCQDPIRRQLLGFDVTENQARRLGTWYPRDADVPLRSWLLQHLGARARDTVGLLTGLPDGWEQRELPTRPSQY